MKKHLFILLFGISSHCYSCGSDDGDGFIHVSQKNNHGVTAEILSEDQILITLPKEFKEGDFSSVSLLIGDYENTDPDIAVPISHYLAEDFVGLSLLYLNDEMQKNATILASYTIKGTTCYSGKITLTGFDELEYSRHWRERDIVNLFSKIQNLEKGMTLDEVWKTLGQPHYESTLFPRSLSEYKNEHALIYKLQKKSKDTQEVFPIVRIVFNNEFQLYKIEADNLGNWSLPEHLYFPNK